MADRLDIVLFGVTGFTGIHCIPYIVQFSKTNGGNLSWGVAGRSETKLKNVLKTMGDKLETNFESIPIVIADVNDKDSLVNMAKRAKLILNCCGPYRFFGEPVVEACIEAGSHHLDVSGESDFMEKIQMKYHEAAEEKGIYVISACGLDSIPADLGIIFMQQKFEGTLNSAETYVKAWSDPPTKGSLINYGTWATLVYGASHFLEMGAVKKSFYKKFPKPPAFPPKLQRKLLPHRPQIVEGWALPFLGSDRSVARRSQAYLYENENVCPVQVATYFIVPSALSVFLFMIFGIVFAMLTRFGFGVKLLLDHPKIFTAGAVSKDSPSEETIQNSWFSIDLYGKGWKEKFNRENQPSGPEDRSIRVRVKGQNPGYGSTCLALVLAGITVLTENDKLANKGKGGVFPPGAAFSKTSLLQRLDDNGLTFEVISQEEIGQTGEKISSKF